MINLQDYPKIITFNEIFEKGEVKAEARAESIAEIERLKAELEEFRSKTK